MLGPGSWKLGIGDSRLGARAWGSEAEHTDHQGVSFLALPVFFFYDVNFSDAVGDVINAEEQSAHVASS